MTSAQFTEQRQAVRMLSPQMFLGHLIQASPNDVLAVKKRRRSGKYVLIRCHKYRDMVPDIYKIRWHTDGVFREFQTSHNEHKRRIQVGTIQLLFNSICYYYYWKCPVLLANNLYWSLHHLLKFTNIMPSTNTRTHTRARTHANTHTQTPFIR